MSNFIDEHVNMDVIDNIGKVYTQELGNINGTIGDTGVKLSSNRTLLLDLGVGVSFPVVGEIIPNMKPPTDYLSCDVYTISDSMRTLRDVYEGGFEINELGYNADTWPAATPEDRSAAVCRFLTVQRMKQRQSLTLDVVSYNSHGLVHSGKAKEMQSPVMFDLNKNSLGHIDRQLSTFNLAKLSREIVSVMFNKDDKLSIAINYDEINPDFRGMIEYEVLDTSLSSEHIIERKRMLITHSVSGVAYVPVTEGLFIDQTYESDITSVVEVIQSECKTAVAIDGENIVSGEWFAINKTSQSMRVSLDNGDVLALDPYGMKKCGAAQPVFATTFKFTYTRPASVSGNIVDGLLYKQRSRFHHGSISGKFVDKIKFAIYDVTAAGAKYISSATGGTYFGPYKVDKDISTYDVVQFGDSNNPIQAIRSQGVDMYFEGQSVYAKAVADVNFQLLSLSTERGNSGEFSIVVGGMKFSSLYEVPTGSVHRDREFMYESNFFITTNAVVGEIIGRVYPTTYFRIKRVHEAICVGASEFPMEDGHVNARNYYSPAEVAGVYSRSEGYISIINNHTVENDDITYSIKAVAGKIGDVPMVVQSFGYVTRATMMAAPSEHFLSAKMRDSYSSRTRKRYAGSIERETANYRIMWIKLKEVGTDETTFIFDHEYDDEHAPHLGHSSYLNQRSACPKSAPHPVSKLTWVTNMLEYTAHWSKTGASIVPGEIEASDLKLNKSCPSYGFGIYGSIETKSIDKIGNIAVTALSAQSSSNLTDSIIITEPEVIQYSNTLFEDASVVAFPDLGFFYISEENITFEDISVYTETQIREPFKRGITIEWADYILEAYLEYVEAETNVFSVYNLIDKSDADNNISISQHFPDGAISTSTMYQVDELYTQRRETDEQKCIPMYLANALMRKYGHVQNILGVWDESSGVIVNDATISFRKDTMSAGYKVYPLCGGAEPIDIVDHYAMLSVYKTGKPYDVSPEVRVAVNKFGRIDGYEATAEAEAEILYLAGDEVGASKRALDGISKNISGDLYMQVSPMLFGMQGPWKNPIDYVTQNEKILLSGELTYSIKPKSRLIMEFSVGPENVLHLNEEGRQFDEMYDIIDGYVEEEVISNDKKTPLQRGDTSYSLKYTNHAGGGILLDRSIVVDLEAYPARLSYPTNNLTRELISPIREDAHSKKMDARAVYVRFDTRYVSESIRSYYDKFIEAPTALTCDSLPEEAVLSRDHENNHSLYKNLTNTVFGNSLMSIGGRILLSFDNDTDETKELTPVYNNTFKLFSAGRGRGVSSFKLDDVYRLIKSHILFRGASEESPQGRDKRDGKFVNTETGA